MVINIDNFEICQQFCTICDRIHSPSNLYHAGGWIEPVKYIINNTIL
jgi:hypothetical protein